MPDDRQGREDAPVSPALPDDELRETLDLLSTVLASVSDRVDAQGVLLDRVNKTAAEARQAAFAARAQTDPRAYGDLVGQAIAGRAASHLDDIEHLSVTLHQTALEVGRTLKEASDDQDRRLHEVHEREREVDAFWARTRWLVLSLPVLFVLLLMVVPRLVALQPAGCMLLGGEWRQTETFRACAFYGP